MFGIYYILIIHEFDTMNTTAWYFQYHALVRRLPRLGIFSTTLWYEPYQNGVLFLVRIIVRPYLSSVSCLPWIFSWWKLTFSSPYWSFSS